MRAEVAVALSGVALMVACVVFELDHRPPRDLGSVELVLTFLSVVVCAGLGVRILQHHPGHRIGWVLVLMAFAGGALTFGEVWAFDALVRGQSRLGAKAADALTSASWVSAYAALSCLALLFPDGRLPGRGWRPLGYACLIVFPLAEVLASVQPGLQDDPFSRVVNPAGITWIGSPAGQVLTGTVMLTMLGCAAGCIAALVDRFVRATGVERQQLMLLLYASSVTPLVLAGCFAGREVTGNHQLADAMFPLVLVLVPFAVGLAVLRYRLYDVERLVNRTAVYVILTAVLIAASILVAWLVGLLVPQSGVASAAVAVLVVLALRPLRELTQGGIDRRFAPSVARARALLRSFTEDLRNGRAGPESLPGVLAMALEDEGLSVRYWVEASGRHVGVDGHFIDAAAGPDRSWFPLGGGAAEVCLKPSTVERRLLLGTVIRESGLAVEIARLSSEVRAQGHFLAHAQLRLATAGFEERRRVERDLHDGAQQRLVGLGLRLRLLQRSLPPQSQTLAPALDGAVKEIGEAIADLRRLASGEIPACLEHGLAAAFTELVRTVPVPVTLELPDGRLPGRVEAAAYFVACEGVTNAVKHAGATAIHVQARVSKAAELHVIVSDDGRGGARFSGGTGLTGLADRLRAHGGTLEVVSPTGAGTWLQAVIPCEL